MLCSFDFTIYNSCFNLSLMRPLMLWKCNNKLWCSTTVLTQSTIKTEAGTEAIRARYTVSYPLMVFNRGDFLFFFHFLCLKMKCLHCFSHDVFYHHELISVTARTALSTSLRTEAQCLVCCVLFSYSCLHFRYGASFLLFFHCAIRMLIFRAN